VDEKVKIIGVLLLALIPVMLIAEYTPKELFTIPWGDGANELKALPGHNEGIVSDTTDYDFEPGHGPSVAFVDKIDNIIIVSHDLYQLKGFDSAGNLIFNLSKGETTLDTNISNHTFSDIYIDTSFQIYLTSSPELSFVPIIKYDGTIIQKIFPFNDSNTTILYFSWSNASVLTFFSPLHGFSTYFSGQLLPVGSSFFIANNGFYYTAYIDEYNGKFTFNKCYNPDKWGRFEWAETTAISIPADSTFYFKTLNGGDGNLLYTLLDYYKDNREINGIYIFDINYNLLDSLFLSISEGFYDFYIDPFVTRDGSIYEFRAKDDGLHVIKWTKK
jgi:hypothetical protein